MTTTRTILAAMLTVLAADQALAQATAMEVKKTSGCGCCLAWMERMQENGFAPQGENMFMGLLIRYKLDQGVPQRMVSCHTATVNGYVIEGRVPAADIRKLLDERPDAVGLAVPGMPLGSPGMDFGDSREAFEVFLIQRDGTTEIFNSYPGN